MDQLDKKLYNDLNIDIGIPDELDTVIKKGLNRKKKHSSILKKVASFFVITFISSSIVFATTSIVHQKKSVWKEPERVVRENFENDKNQNVSNENIMSKDDAIEKAYEILEIFGYKDNQVKEIELQHHIDDYDSSWYITTTQNISITIDSSGDGSFSISPNNVFNEDMKNYRTTREGAVNTAREIAKQYGYDTAGYENVDISSNMNSEEESYRYIVTFYREYDGLINPYERIQIVFIPQINMLENFWISNKKCENNPIEITKEQAQEIALAEEQKLSEKYDVYEIDKVETEFRIVTTNGAADFRLNEYEQLHNQTSAGYPNEKWVFYRTDSRVRKAWLVRIIYKIPDNVNRFDGSFNVNDEKFSYFVDATTGEIIGGGSIF